MGASLSIILEFITKMAPHIAPIVLAILQNRPTAPVSIPSVPAGSSREEIIRRAHDRVVCARSGRRLNAQTSYNWGIAGTSGAGKSTLINALRGIDDMDPDAAVVGETETTQRIASYPFQSPRQHMVLWDLPGAGTIGHPTGSYVEDKGLLAFDAVILVYKRGSSMEFLRVVEALIAFDKPVAVVRTKADDDIRSKMRRGKTLIQAKTELRQEMEHEIQTNIGASNYAKVNRFLVSGWDYHLGQFDEVALSAFLLTSAATRFPAGRA